VFYKELRYKILGNVFVKRIITWWYGKWGMPCVHYEQDNCCWEQVCLL